jgi:hypothetical protein
MITSYETNLKKYIVIQFSTNQILKKKQLKKTRANLN